MNRLLAPGLLQRLTRAKLIVRRTVASGGVGERRSRARGPGIEFADHREYQVGDDIRYLDRHVFARLGQNVVRQYTVEQQLQVTVLLDASASMAVGDGSKLQRARELAGVLTYVALAGGDAVQVGVVAEGGVRWHPRRSGLRRAPEVLTFLEGAAGRGAIDLAQVVGASQRRLPVEGVVCLVSDLFLDGLGDAAARWRDWGQELIAVQVLAPEERHPALLGQGPLRVVDAETGDEVAVTIDEAAERRYAAVLAAWQVDQRAAVAAAGGRLVTVASDEPLETLVLTKWRQGGLLA